MSEIIGLHKEGDKNQIRKCSDYSDWHLYDSHCTVCFMDSFNSKNNEYNPPSFFLKKKKQNLELWNNLIKFMSPENN